MKKIHTTIAASYVREWGSFEGIREIIQNGLDAHDKGFKLGISYVRKKQTLLIWNKGAKLRSHNLLLGSTSKDMDAKQRGKYGEGFKVGSLALIREGKSVTIEFERERWKAVIDESPQFDDQEVLTFETGATRAKSDKLLFTIGGVTPHEWKEMRQKFLPIYSPEKQSIFRGPSGSVLMDKDLKGHIYCGGIFVTHDESFGYGYDFKPTSLELNRDRNMVDSFNLKWNTSKLWAYMTANRKGKLYDAKDMLEKGMPDVEYLESFADYTVKGKMVEKFFEDNSNNRRAYPVTSEGEAKQVRSMGYSPVYSSSSYSGVLRSSLGSLDDLKRKVECDYSIFRKMTPIDDANLQWVFEVMWKVAPKWDFEIAVVKFKLDSTRSIYEDKKLMLSSGLLSRKYDILQEAVAMYCQRENKALGEVWKKLYQQTVEGM